MEVILFNITLTCTIVIAFNLLVVELNDSLSFEMFIAFVDLGVVLTLTAVYYFHSEWITADLWEISDNFYNSPWSLLLVKHQKLLVLPIQRGQREFRLKGLGLFNCSLPVFVMVSQQNKQYFRSSLISIYFVDYPNCRILFPHHSKFLDGALRLRGFEKLDNCPQIVTQQMKLFKPKALSSLNKSFCPSVEVRNFAVS